jgi:germination protein M
MASWTKSKRNRRLWLLLFAAIGLGFIVALALTKTFSPGSEPPAGQSRVRDAVALQAATTRKVHLYFASRNGRYLQAEERRIEVKDTVSAIEAIVVALLEGPEDSKLVSTIPATTQLLNLFLTDDGTAYVNFTQELSRLHPGGVTAERLTFYAIVNSLVLNLDSVERVQLLIEGKPAPTLSGHLDIRHPMMGNLLIVR